MARTRTPIRHTRANLFVDVATTAFFALLGWLAWNLPEAF